MHKTMEKLSNLAKNWGNSTISTIILISKPNNVPRFHILVVSITKNSPEKKSFHEKTKMNDSKNIFFVKSKILVSELFLIF